MKTDNVLAGLTVPGLEGVSFDAARVDEVTMEAKSPVSQNFGGRAEGFLEDIGFDEVTEDKPYRTTAHRFV